MKSIKKMTSEARKEAFSKFLMDLGKEKVVGRYINDLEKGFAGANISQYKNIFDVSDPSFLEESAINKALKSTKEFSRGTKGGTAGLAGLNWYIIFLKTESDSYYGFMKSFNIKPKELIQWGMKTIIFPEDEKVDLLWNDLKQRISHGGEVTIRGYGRDAKGTELYINFYKELFDGIDVKKDSSNNAVPKANIERMTGLVRNKDIFNYQISHIWGRTKNVFLFEAPWNICYTPKLIDPFTGHESKGDLSDAFKECFVGMAAKKYKKYIVDYNNIISELDIEQKLIEYCNKYNVNNERFVRDALKELSPIQL